MKDHRISVLENLLLHADISGASTIAVKREDLRHLIDNALGTNAYDAKYEAQLKRAGGDATLLRR